MCPARPRVLVLSVSWPLHSWRAGAGLQRMICRRAPDPGRLFCACGSVLLLEFDWSLATLQSDGIPAGVNCLFSAMMGALLGERTDILLDA